MTILEYYLDGEQHLYRVYLVTVVPCLASPSKSLSEQILIIRDVLMAIENPHQDQNGCKHI